MLALGTEAAPYLLPGRSRWTREGDRLLSKGWLAETSKLAHMGARLPERASDTFEAALGRDTHYMLRLTAEGAQDKSRAEEHDGRVLYAEAYKSTDLIVISEDERFEQFLLLRDPSAPTHFTWRVERSSKLAKAEQEPTNSVLFSTAEGRDMLRIAAPIAVGANGERRQPELRWDGDRIHLSIDTSGLTWPVLLDPVIEAPNWKQLTVSGPPARRGHGMAENNWGAGAPIVLFGGVRWNGSSATYFDDTWEWMNGAWTQKTPSPKPSARAFGALGTTLNGVLLFGGTTGANETWIYDANTWTRQYPTTVPPDRYAAGMAFSPNGTMLFGGNVPGSASKLHDAYTWFFGWTPQSTSSGPTYSSFVAMAYEWSPPYRTLVTGGDTEAAGTNTSNAFYWFDSNTGWGNALWGLGSSTYRAYHAMAYDQVRKVSVLFGGSSQDDCAAPQYTTMELSGQTVTTITPALHPSARCFHAMAWDPSGKRILMFGGGTSAFNQLGDTWVYQQVGIGCSSNDQCITGFCVDGVCCDKACAGSCERCNDPTSVGSCKPITTLGQEDPGTCSGDRACFTDGTCKLKQGRACTASTECLTQSCSDSVCCNTACDQSCDACNTARGATVDGECQAAKRGDPGSPVCSTYACSGSSTSCPDPSVATCLNDGDCAASYYCGTNGKCLARKTQGQGCDPANECKGGSCRICASDLPCVDGYCCNSTCAGECNACNISGKLGTCSNQAAGYAGNPVCPGAACNGGSTCPGSACTKDTDCNSSYYCSANGTCQLVKTVGSACDATANCKVAGCRVCGDKSCTDGFCCNDACQDPCGSCSITQGLCSPSLDGAAPRTSICGPYLCDGQNKSCANNCFSDADCTADSYCATTHQCVARKAQAAACGSSSTNACLVGGCRECIDGMQCVDGYCCNSACGNDCDSCSLVPGTCSTMPAGATGNASCSPFVCDGTSTSCPASCTLNSHCAAGYHCEAGQCKANKQDGEPCSSDPECANSHCADNVCCNTACTGSCDRCDLTGAKGTCSLAAKGTLALGCSYLCDGSSAACPTQCNADAECAPGLYCNGAKHCVARKANGASCDALNDCVGGGCQMCASGNCVDGVCCDTACANACDSCNQTGLVGTCSPKPANDPGSPACPGAACNGASPTCPGSACSSSSQCNTGYYCAADNNCQPQKQQGQACDSTIDCKVAGCPVCANGSCADGFCCNSPCTSACDRCDVKQGTCTPAPAGSAPSPTCGAYLCNGTSTSCPSNCTSDYDCGTDSFCSANNQCVSRKDKGQTCGPTSSVPCAQSGCHECKAGLSCADGYCCDAPCNGRCDSCKVSPGTCTIVDKGLDGDPTCGAYLCDGTAADCPQLCAANADCAKGFHCEFDKCKSDKAAGQTCSSKAECTSGFCVDGFCCNTACTGACEVCAASAGAVSDGQCSPAPKGTPSAACGTVLCSGTSGACPGGCTSDADCAADSFCAAGGTCAPSKNVGDSCATTDCAQGNCRNCASGFCVDGYCCETACAGKCDTCGQTPGTCQLMTKGTSGGCGAYVCDGKNAGCPGMCSTNDDCTVESFCDNGACIAKKGPGQTCNQATDCDTGYCSEGVCCDTACTGQCQACDVVKGKCTVISGAPRPGKQACKGTGDCAGTCNGADLTCRYPGDTTTCGTTSCTNDVFRPQVCDGTGSCVDSQPKPCTPYACDDKGKACRSSCISNADCTAGAECDPQTLRCSQSGSSCLDDWTAVSSSGTKTSCVPYRCAAGACMELCDVAADCAPSYECVSRTCVKAAGVEAGTDQPQASVSSDTGCGCRTQDTGRAPAWPVGLAIAALTASLRLRRRRKSQARASSKEAA